MRGRRAQPTQPDAGELRPSKPLFGVKNQSTPEDKEGKGEKSRDRLRNSIIRFYGPTEPVGVGDWSALS